MGPVEGAGSAGGADAGERAAASTLADRIDAVLPQTQCTRCGFDGCRPYADAVAEGLVGIDRCPPGGAAGIVLLARVTGLPAVPLDPACGTEGPLMQAFIDETICIGCAKCIDACPVDAIVGAHRLMHTVLPPLCTGCELCVAPCPVDCIEMRLPVPPREWTAVDAHAARARHDARRLRLLREREEEAARLALRAAEQRAALAALRRAEPTAPAAPATPTTTAAPAAPAAIADR